MFSLGAPAMGGGTPSSEAAELEVEVLSLTLDIFFPIGTLIISELKG